MEKCSKDSTQEDLKQLTTKIEQPEVNSKQSTTKVEQPETNHQESQDLKEERLDSRLYTIFRLDGHSFSKFVKAFKMNLPFDKDFTVAMRNTANEGFKYFTFFIGFVGSDEISFAMKPLTELQIQNKSVLEFNGRVQKMVSLLAGKISTLFFIELTKLAGFEKTKQFTPHFDCRVFQVKTLKNVLEQISDRVKFTLKNSRMMLAQTYYNQKQLNKIASKEAVSKLLSEKEIDFNVVVPAENRVGTILTFEKVKEKKEVQIKGVLTEVQFERKNVRERNQGPKEVLELEMQFAQ